MEKFGICYDGRMMAGCGKVENDVLKNVWKMEACFYEKSVKLKSVDEHPHKQVKIKKTQTLTAGKTATKIKIVISGR